MPVDYETILTPQRVWFTLTGVCNNFCTWCYRKGSEIQKFLDSSLILLAAKTLSACGTKRCSITGGEPMLHPDCYTLVRQLTEDDLFSSVALATNGRLLASSVPDEWSTKANFSVTVSLHGVNPTHYRENTGSEEGFTQSIQAIRNLKAKRVRCMVNVVLGKENLPQINSFINLVKDLGIEMLGFTNGVPSIDDPAYANDPYKIAEIASAINYFCDKLGQKYCFVWNLPWCMLKKDLLEVLLATHKLEFNCPVPDGKSVVVREDGALSLCTHTTGFELVNKKKARIILSSTELFLDFWNSIEMQMLRQEASVYRHQNCVTCIYKDNCRGGCPLWWQFYDFGDIISRKGGDYNDEK